MTTDKKTIVLMGLIGLMGNTATAQELENEDSIRMEHIQEVVVRGVRAPQSAPFAVTNIKKEELQDHSKTGRELPFLLAKTPGIMGWGENGIGTGTAYMRIRGVRGARINVTSTGQCASAARRWHKYER